MNLKIQSRRGFTLIEVLVVAAVITILCALSISAVNRLQAGSQNAKCLANLRATGAAALAYFSDRNGKFFPNKFWYSRASWDKDPGMRDYLGIMSRDKVDSEVYRVDTILTCPRLKSLHPLKFPSFLNRAYTMNYYLQMKDPSSSYNNNEEARPPLPGGALQMSGVPRLSAMWMFTDGTAANNGAGEYHTAAKPGYETYMFFPHHGRQNAVFMDGHVESLTLEEWQNPRSRREFWGDLSASD